MINIIAINNPFEPICFPIYIDTIRNTSSVAISVKVLISFSLSELFDSRVKESDSIKLVIVSNTIDVKIVLIIFMSFSLGGAFNYMSTFLYIVPKTIFFYLILVIVMKVMGKREVGQLSIFDMAVFFIISDMFSLSIDGGFKLIIKTSIATVTIVMLQLFTARLILKHDNFRDVVDGRASLIINDGVLDQKEMRKQNYNIDDLFTQLRINDIKDISNIKYALLESSGNLSIIREEDNVLFPYPFIKDGKIDYESLEIYKKDERWLMEMLSGVSVDEVFIAFLKKDGMYIVRKEFS